MHPILLIFSSILISATSFASDILKNPAPDYVGTYNITNYAHSDSHTSDGVIEIKADGTFSLISGSFAAAGMGSHGFCSNTGEKQTIKQLGDKLFIVTHYNPGEEGMPIDPPAKNEVVVTIVETASRDRGDTTSELTTLIVKGTGGCGTVTERVSVLKKILD